MKRVKRGLSIALCVCMMLVPLPVVAANNTATTNTGTAGYQVQGKKYTFKPSKDSNSNYNSLQSMLRGNSKKTIIIPRGSNFVVNGSLTPGSNTMIIATGATITFTKTKAAIFTVPKATNYKSFKNLTVVGGTWKSQDKGGRMGTMFSLSHGSDILFDGVTTTTNVRGHAMEIIACKNVVVKNCNLSTVGKCPKSCHECVVQIDIATKASAPKVAKYGAKYVKGQTCKNVTISNCVVSGPSAIRATMQKGKSFIGKYHRNIKIIGNTLTSATSETLSLLNTVGVSIKNNKITCKTPGSSNMYSVGIHVNAYGKGPSSLRTKKVEIVNNTIKKSGFRSIFIFNHAKKYGKVILKNNTLYCKKGAKAALYVSDIKKSAKKTTIKGNTCKKSK